MVVTTGLKNKQQSTMLPTPVTILIASAHVHAWPISAMYDRRLSHRRAKQDRSSAKSKSDYAER